MMWTIVNAFELVFISISLFDVINCDTSTITSNKSTQPAVSSGQNVACDFESGTFCSWKNDPRFPWNITSNSGAIGANPLMPKKDHTMKSNLGHFAYVSHTDEDRKHSISSKYAYLTSMKVAGSLNKDKTCLTLWYYMRATKFCRLNVTVTTEEHSLIKYVTRMYDHGDIWNKLSVETDTQTVNTVYKIGADIQNAVVAIDDINIQFGACPVLAQFVNID